MPMPLLLAPLGCRDASIITFVGWLDKQQPREDRFMIEWLAETAVFIRHDRLDFVQEQIRQYVASMASLKNKGDVDQEDDGLGAKDGDEEGKQSSRKASKAATRTRNKGTAASKRAAASASSSAAASMAAARAEPKRRTSRRSKQATAKAAAVRGIDEAESDEDDAGVVDLAHEDHEDEDEDEDISHLLEDDEDVEAADSGDDDDDFTGD
jgi:hypothetical protein